jgi:hypothetical protein
MKWIFKLTSESRPNECVVWYGGTTHKHPETQFKYYIKSQLKKYMENTQKKIYRPYFPFAKDTRVNAEIIGKTALDNEEELIKYCNSLTIILNNYRSIENPERFSIDTRISI